MALLGAVLDMIRHEYTKSEPVWKATPLLPTDLAFLENECSASSEFDPFGWRKEMFHKYKKGKAVIDVRQCEYGCVIAIMDHNTHGITHSIPWGLWGRILRLYGQGKRAKIFFLVNPYLRTFPKETRSIDSSTVMYGAIGPSNINGGYTYPCNKETIVIYRAEDATRVLIHELQHASCLDHMENGTDLVEAETEAWAELLYAGLLSQGKKVLFHELVKKQVDWMISQNVAVKRHMRHDRQFPWRYTVGKEDVWRRWGLIKDDVRAAHTTHTTHTHQHSLRLTPPPSEALKRVFGVDSNVL